MYSKCFLDINKLTIRAGQKLSLLMKIVKKISVFFLENIVKSQVMVTEQFSFAVVISL